MPSEEVLRLLKARAAVKPLPRIALNCLKAQGVAHNGSPGLTYRGFVRQIRGVSRVAMSQALSPSWEIDAFNAFDWVPVLGRFFDGSLFQYVRDSVCGKSKA